MNPKRMIAWAFPPAWLQYTAVSSKTFTTKY